jgi:uncharacterized protein (PEP-CTERM system associated)
MSTATEQPGVLFLVGAAVGGVALQLAPAPVQAQKLRLDLSMETQVVTTSNAAQLAGEAAQGDLLLDLHPRMRLQTQGAGLKLDLTLGMIARSYARRTLPNRAEPELDLRASAEVVEGWVTVDTLHRSARFTHRPAGQLIPPDTWRRHAEAQARTLAGVGLAGQPGPRLAAQ